MARIDGVNLTWRDSGDSADLTSLVARGGLPGVALDAVAGRNGPGRGYLKLSPAGTSLSWCPPGRTFGTAVDVSAGGTFTLGGTDPDRWVTVTVTAAQLSAGPLIQRIMLTDAIDTALCSADITAAQAAAGNTADWSILVKNESGATMNNLTVWVPAACEDIEIRKSAGDSWVTPRGDLPAQAAFGTVNLAADATQAVYVQRTIAAGQAAHPARPIVLRCAWDDSEGGRAHATVRGLYRIFNAAGYRLYYEDGRTPEPGRDTVRDTNASVPWTPTFNFKSADADYRVGVTYTDGINESGLVVPTRIEIDSGAKLPARQRKPARFWMAPDADGVVIVKAIYHKPRDANAETAATHWAIWYTTDGSDPDTGTAPDYTETMTFAKGVARLAKSLPAQADGTTVKVAVRTRRTVAAAAVDCDTLTDQSVVAEDACAEVGYAKLGKPGGIL